MIKMDMIKVTFNMARLSWPLVTAVVVSPYTKLKPSCECQQGGYELSRQFVC